MTRPILAFISISVLALFLFVLASAQLMKRPWSPEEDIPSFLGQLETTLQPPIDWAESLELQEQIEHAWSRIEKRVLFSVEKDDMTQFTVELVRLKAAIEKEEEGTAWEALSLLKTVWNRMR